MKRFYTPEALWLLLLLIPLVLSYFYTERRGRSALTFSHSAPLESIPVGWAVYLRHILILLRLGGMALLIIALARPQRGDQHEHIVSDGIDIMLTLDLSTSMRALDFKPSNRLEVAKEQTQEFLTHRTGDNIGLTIFAGRSYLKCPLTRDYDLLSSFIEDLDFGPSIEDGTAIGTALVTAAKHLQAGQSENKVILLFTDGANNRGDIQPLTAARAVAEQGIRIHTIAIGREGRVPYPFIHGQDTIIREIESDYDAEELQEIARIGGGEFFLAESTQELEEIYKAIDELETTEVEIEKWVAWSEEFYRWLLWGSLLIFLEILLRHTRFRRFP
ncbi:VWA domain-containing protein [Chitinivibrio alkaliphilus]|uniref:VWFA domain-containing protein n=1 Tax=Chitinivibrio alkaliphilus ACht1 TaxID=1313304 RepID=U7DB01_9BACT|nr:VWA domain-containing protein [Chitinivibrio alkaliphilus]ERP38748.1 hypothetical protein CALK_0767 [Chitinivibrio alkaliphilus ACht1]